MVYTGAMSARKLTAMWVAVLFGVVGLLVYAPGLMNPFMGDDNGQIVQNPAVHSLANVGDFFNGGTMYSGQGTTKLTGIFYRPVMTTAYAVVYAVFGLKPVAFHALQLALFVSGAVLVFMVLRYFVRPGWALAAALVFLVHPLNSQAAYAIPALQEPLFFDFGMGALWLLLRFKGWWAELAAVACVGLSLLSKESGVLFVGIILVYLWLFDRRRVWRVGAGLLLVCAAYAGLKAHAVGLLAHDHIAPIDDLNLAGRLATVPAIVAHYLGRFVWPVNLGSAYFWTYPATSPGHFWLPLAVEITLVLLGVWLGVSLWQGAHRRVFLTYVLFAAWLVMGLLLHLQIIPLDMTACDTWFYFPMAGLLGMLAVAAQQYLGRVDRRWLVAGVGVVVVVLGALTAARGRDWASNPRLALADLKSSPGNFVAEYQLADYWQARGKLSQAEALARRSVQTYPTGTNWDILGKIYMTEGNYARAHEALAAGINRQPIYPLYRDYAALSVVYGQPAENVALLEGWSRKLPDDAIVWAALAVAHYRTGDMPGAQSAAAKAHGLSDNTAVTTIYTQIMRGGELRLN
jgi:hypothetical protein